MTKRDYAVTFAIELKNQLKKFGWTVEEIAKESGINKGTISKYISLDNDIIPTLPTIINLAEAIGCSVDDLINYEEFVE